MKSLDKIVAVAGGCLVFATGGGSVAAGAALVGSGASLLNAWVAGRAKHGPESKRVLAGIRKKVRTEFAEDGLSEAERSRLVRADEALGQILLDCIPPPERLAQANGHRDGFVKAATTMVIMEVAAKDELFAELGERADPLARRFACAAIEGALESALTNRDYFDRLMPFVLERMGRDLGTIQENQVEQGTSLQRITSDVAEVKTLLRKYGASSQGQRAIEQIGDARPFILLARKINLDVDDDQQAFAELAAAVEHLLEVQATAERGTNLSGWVAAALRLIAERSRHGEFDAAAKEAERAFADWRRHEAERRALVEQEGLRLIEANIDQNMLRRDPGAVARWIEQRIMVQQGTKTADVAALLEASAEHLARGQCRGLLFDLDVAAAITRRALPSCRDSSQRGAALLAHGQALAARGGQELGTARLWEALVAFSLAQDFCPRERVPLAWAMVQNNLGQVLGDLGKRERGTARLKKAVAVLREALRERKRGLVPIEWAQTQSNLGQVLVDLGTREGGTARLKKAVAAFRAALPEQERARDALAWARTQRSLGDALSKLAERESGAAHLEQAVAAYRAALQEQPRERQPLEWAMTQHNLANSLVSLSCYEEGTEGQKNAVAAYGAALEELTFERNPLTWATAQTNLGIALWLLHEREGGAVSRLESAVAAYDAALKVHAREQMPLEWAGNTLRRAVAAGGLASRNRDAADLDAAIASAREAQAVVVEANDAPQTSLAAAVLGELHRMRENLT